MGTSAPLTKKLEEEVVASARALELDTVSHVTSLPGAPTQHWHRDTTQMLTKGELELQAREEDIRWRIARFHTVFMTVQVRICNKYSGLMVNQLSSSTSQ